MKKQFLLLSLVLITLIIPCQVFAEEINFDEYEKLVTDDFFGGTLESGDYILSGDIDLTDYDNITIDEDTIVNLCLNGYVLKGRGAGFGIDSVIVNYGTLNIYDYNTTREHKFCDDDGLWLWDDSLSGDDIKHSITGGVITGGTGSVDSDSGNTFGGGILNFGTLTINGGSIVRKLCGLWWRNI